MAAFLAWSRKHSQYHPAWHLLAMTGMRRGELLALRWKDVDLDAGTVTVRRSAGLISDGGRKKTVEGPTKTGKARVVDLDDGTVAVLKNHRKDRAKVNLALAKLDALFFGDAGGKTRHPERFSRTWIETVARYRKALGDDAPPAIRLHDLRHSHATSWLLAGEPVHVVSQRLGHASPVQTLETYAHVMPGNQRQAAQRHAERVAQA
jgi:integrase